MKRRRYALMAAMLAVSLPVIALDSASLFDGEIYKELKEKGSIERSYFMEDGASLSLYPNTPAGRQAASSWPADKEKPVFLVEELYLIPKSKLGTGNPSRTTIDYASKIIRSVSKMQGMQYYSHTDKKIETLYKEAYFIAGPNDTRRIEDDTAGNADGKIAYCMLNDSSLGKANYRLSYFERPDEVSGSFVNISPLKIGPVKAITDGNLIISLVISDCGDDMLVYLVTQAKVPTLKLFKTTMYDSFTSRLEALYTWFCSQF